MKNLKLLTKSITTISSDVLSVSLTTNMEDGLFCATRNRIFLSNESVSKTIVSDFMDNITVLQNGLSVYCATEKSVFSYDNFNGMLLDKIDFSLRILALSVCPDESMLLVLTDDLMITILSNELEILSEFYLEQIGFGTAEPLTVGWGKKETQFHGKSGKESRNIKEKVDDSSTFDTEKVFITWRDDGEFFAVSWNCASQIQTDVNVGARLIRIFSKDGELFSTSEAINTLENGLFWRTKCSLVATSCRSPKGLEIVFIEQNGLKHGGFTLYERGNCEHKTVTSVQFAPAEDICTVTIQDIETKQTYVQLYNTNNYHWYLKQHIICDGLRPVHTAWSNDKLHLCTSNGSHSVYQWYEEVDRSLIREYQCSEEQEYDKSPNLVCVIDGKKLLVTPFENCAVPPPYCAFSLEFEDYVSFVSLPTLKSIDSDAISCFVQFSNGSCQWLKLRKDADCSAVAGVTSKIELGRKIHQYAPISSVTLNLDCNVNKISWIDNDSFYGSFGNCLHLCRRNDSDIEIKKIDVDGINVGNICHSDKVYVQDSMGAVYILEDEPRFLFKFSTFCQEMFTLTLKSEDSDTIVGLSRRFNQLFVNNNLQSGSFLSVLALKNHVIFTNVNQKLRCLNYTRLTQKDFVHMLDDKNYNAKCDFDETLRLIEPGTEIITCVPVDSKIILMMPRGNLETIYPRALILDELKRAMDGNIYSQSIEKMRRHRVNFNLLYDHNPERFLGNLERIIQENRKGDRLILIISELSNENVTETMYKRFYDNSDRQIALVKDDEQQQKVNRICSAIIKIIGEENVPEDFLFPILTSFVKMSPSRSDKALKMLCKFKENDNIAIWEKGLKYLQYLISIDDLYRVALSTYDLNVTLQVAQKTQLDPKEYVDFLNDLHELPCEHYRRYKICLFLKQYTTALECLSPVAEIHWEEFIELVTQHSLYIRSLQLFPVGSSPFNEISALFADNLITKSNDLKSAGMVYLRTGERSLCEKAAKCFMGTLNWKEWCIAAKKSEMSPTDIDSNLNHLAERLSDLGRQKESMTIYEMYLNNLEKALAVSLSAMLFTDSFRIVTRMSPMASTDQWSLVERELMTASRSLVRQLDEMYLTFTDDVQRLQVVRTEFVSKFSEMQLTGEDEVLPGYMSDTMSEVSSVHSSSSRMSAKSNYSQKSNSSRKKPVAKKLWSAKFGSQKEEVGIMDKLNTNIKNTQNLTDEIKSLVEILCFVNQIEQGSLLLAKINKLLSVHSSSIDIIWDNFVFDRTFELSEYEYPISSHIKVSRGPNFTGRRRYMIDEEFLRQPPQMKIGAVKYPVTN